MKTLALFAISSIFTISSYAHFVLKTPVSIGFKDVEEGQAPCGGFDIKTRNTVTMWPIAGYPIYMISTHTRATYHYKVALSNSTDELVDLQLPIGQQGLGDFCLPNVPGKAEWVGLDAVVQITQDATDGTLYQCAAIKFVEGPAFAPDSACKNGTGLQASFIATTSASPSPTSQNTGSSSPKPTSKTLSGATKAFELRANAGSAGTALGMLGMVLGLMF